MRLPLALLLLASPALAETPITADQFDAFASGKTLIWSQDGQAYGLESYLPGRKLLWSEEGGTCLSGSYAQAANGQICFTYDDATPPDCWLLYPAGDALHGTLQSDAEPRPDYGISVSPTPLDCAASGN